MDQYGEMEKERNGKNKKNVENAIEIKKRSKGTQIIETSTPHI